MAKSALEKHLDRLIKRRESDMGYWQQRRRGGLSMLGESSALTSRKLEAFGRREDFTPAAMNNLLAGQQGQYLEAQRKTEAEFLGKEQETKEKYAGQISEAEYQIDIEKEQKKKQEKAAKGGLISMGGKLLGAAASFIPGVGAVVGSAIPALTDLAIGLDQSYDPVMRQQMIGSALNETLGGISAMATLKTEKKFTEDFGAAYQLGEGLKGQERINFLQEIMLGLNLGSFKHMIKD